MPHLILISPSLGLLFVSPQDERWVLAMQSVYEESLPRPSVDAVRAEVLPSAWILQPIRRHGQERVNVIYMLQVCQMNILSGTGNGNPF